MSAAKKWQHVVWANKAFIHENLHAHLKTTLSKLSDGGSHSAPSKKEFYSSLFDFLDSTGKEVWYHCLVMEMPMADYTLRQALIHWGQKRHDVQTPALSNPTMAAHWPSPITAERLLGYSASSPMANWMLKCPTCRCDCLSIWKVSSSSITHLLTSHPPKEMGWLSTRLGGIT